MTEDFARLERHHNLQVLCYVEEQEVDGKHGPCLVTRCDPAGISVSTKLGPWEDSEQGWEQATQALKNRDLKAYAAEMNQLSKNLFEETE